MLFNRLDRVAAARDEVCRIELELDELRIRVFEDEIQICRALAESVEVIVVAEWNAQVGSSLAQLCLEGAKTFSDPSFLNMRVSWLPLLSIFSAVAPSAHHHPNAVFIETTQRSLSSGDYTSKRS